MSDYNAIRDWHNDSTLREVKQQLEKRGFTAVIAPSPGEAARQIMETVPAGSTVGLGGSVSTRELGLDRLLEERGHRLFNHWDERLSPGERLDMRKNQLTCDVFITGVNAITLDGRIVNIDGIGNRVASMIYGPRQVIAVAGINKVARDIDDAMWRIKNIASPRNSKRLGLKTPCAATGRCTDCGEGSSACRVTTILEYRPSLTSFMVVLVPHVLGF